MVSFFSPHDCRAWLIRGGGWKRLKRTEVEEKPKLLKKPAKKEHVVKPAATSKRDADGEEGEEGRKDDEFTSVGKGGKPAVVYTTDILFKKLREVQEARGKKVISPPSFKNSQLINGE